MRNITARTNKTIALACIIMLISTLFTGCAHTGSRTPDALVARLFKSIINRDVDDYMDCSAPGISTSIITAAIKKTTEEQLNSFLDSIYQSMGFQSGETPPLSATPLIVSRQYDAQTTIVRTIVIFSGGGKMLLSEQYIHAYCIGNLWYLMTTYNTAPFNYTPNQSVMKASTLAMLLEQIAATKAVTPKQTAFDKKAQIRKLVELSNGHVVDRELMRLTWDEIDRYRNAQNHTFDMYVEVDNPLYYFELFVDEYRKDTGLRVSVAASEIVSNTKNFIPDIVNYFSGDFDSMPLAKSLDKDQKIAQIVIDYLLMLDLRSQEEKADAVLKMGEDYAEFVDGIADIYIAIDGDINYTEVLKNLYNARDTLPDDLAMIITNVQNGKLSSASDNLLATLLLNVKVTNEVDGKTYRMGDMFNITKHNAQTLYGKICNIIRKTQRGQKVQLSLNDDFGVPVKQSFKKALASAKRVSGGRSIYDYIDDEIETSKKNASQVKTMNTLQTMAWFLSASIEALDATNQLIRYQDVLDAQGQYLQKILESSGCKSAEKISKEVIDTLTEVAAKGIVDTVMNAYGKAAAAKLLEDATEEIVKDIATKAFSNANVYMLAFDLSTSAAMWLCDAAKTKLQVWGTEDLYDEFQKVKNQLTLAMDLFYNYPTETTYERLYYTKEYYALMVRSGASKVSSIICADMESLRAKFFNLFSSSAVDLRLQDIEEAKKIPERDERTLQIFLQKLFPSP